MSHAIRARFKPTPADYVKVTLAFYFAQRSIRWLIVFSVLFAGMAVPVSLIYRRQGSTIAIYILVIAVGYVLTAAATLAAPLMRIHKQARQDEKMQVETTWSIEADQIEVRTRYEKTELVWGMFDHLIDAHGYLILVYAENRRQFAFLPKSAFLNQNDCMEFMQLAQTNLS